MFEHIPPYAGDPILSLVETFLNDPREQKVNLGIGLFYDDEGKIPLLAPVQEAEKRLVAQNRPRSYLPMEGYAPFREAAREYVLGADHEAVLSKRVATIQTIGGSGALRLCAEFLHRFFPQSEIWISDPTWDNHNAIFNAAGVKAHAYPYYDSAKNQIRFDEMLACIKALPKGSMVLMHPCCHNPTGMDLSQDQLKQLLPVFKERELMAYLDIAYQGFGQGIEEDAWAVREFAALGIPCFIGSSFSKNCGLYGERIGVLNVVCANEKEALCVLGQLKLGVRQSYSSPPTHGAAIVATVLRDSVLRKQWEDEVNQMRARIQKMRIVLQDVISAKVPGRDFSYFTTQQGMFSYTGLSEQQVDRLREEFGVYLVRTGRMCIAGLNSRNVEYVAQCMAQVMA